MADATANPAVPPAPKLSKVLPTTRIAFAKQIQMLRAFGASYVATSKPVTSVQVAELVEIHESTARLVNAFFLDVGLMVKSEQANLGFVPSGDVIAMHRAYEWSQQNPERKLYPTFKDTWFAKALTTKLMFRGSLDESEAVGILADAAQAGPEYRAQLAVAIAFLESSGVVERDGIMLRLAKPDAQANDPKPQIEDKPTPRQPVNEPSEAMRVVRLPRAGGSLQLSGDVNLFALTGDERKLVFDLIDLMQTFEDQLKEADSI
jgi:hypothetical protein